MATVVTNPAPAQTNDNSGMGFLLGVLLIIVFAVLFFIYVIPMIGNVASNSGPQVNVPGKVDVNVKGTK